MTNIFPKVWHKFQKSMYESFGNKIELQKGNQYLTEEVRNCIVLNPIGIVDKNEQMIYDGDLLRGKTDKGGYEVVVTWNPLLAAYELRYNEYSLPFTGLTKKHLDGVVRMKDFEVIGNKFENDESYQKIRPQS